MSKRLLVVLLVVGFVVASLVVCAVPAEAARRGRRGEPKISRAEKERGVLMGNAKAYLNGKVITLYTSLETEKGKKLKRAKKSTDIVSFTNRRVVSKLMQSLGYGKGGSNYSITAVAADGGFTWETMQKHENKDDYALLRGDVKPDGSMTGSMDVKSMSRGRKIYRFATSPAKKTKK